MTTALLVLAALLAALVGYRLWKLPQALAAKQAGDIAKSLGALTAEPVVPPTGHMVFAGPLEHNEHGFITTPLVACVDPACNCRRRPLALKN